jgi:hypothetical protein
MAMDTYVVITSDHVEARNKNKKISINILAGAVFVKL